MFKTKMIDTLSKVEVFDGLTRDDLKIGSKACQRIHFTEGETLIEMGKPSAGFYILIKGQVKVILPEQIQGGKAHRISQITLNTLKEGDCFGEYSLIEKGPGSASVVGFQPGEALKLDKSGFETLMSSDRIGRAVYKNLLRILIRRLRNKEKELDLVLIAG